MPAPDRLDLTLRLVRGSGRLTLAELATRLGVSEMTVRRDLDQLQEQGLVRRVRGGAVALDVPVDEAGFDVRAQWQSATKARLAAAAADLIAPGGTVLLDAGTTTAAVAAALAARFGAAPSPSGPLTVAVLSLQAAVRLADQPGIRLLILGGESRAGERSLVGPLALSALDQLRFDTFIMSIGAVHHDLGWSEFDLDDAAVKRAALRRAGRTIVVADASKLGVQAFARVAPLSAADIFVTSTAAPPAATSSATGTGGASGAATRAGVAAGDDPSVSVTSAGGPSGGATPAGGAPGSATLVGSAPGGATLVGGVPGGGPSISATSAGGPSGGATPTGGGPGGAILFGGVPGGGPSISATSGAATPAGGPSRSATSAGATPDNATPGNATPGNATPDGGAAYGSAASHGAAATDAAAETLAALRAAGVDVITTDNPEEFPS
ncbi:DeoR/GlpR family DNA-binding transcription regulator [Dactylosporangium sp. NPDC049742]|uniref:DeoR/GlpR family DNA-binding transcription regulator n=1 Tax=Dactylosporangium sp. NPDC049742 TaxID=3154737 RepID=UPI00343183C6